MKGWLLKVLKEILYEILSSPEFHEFIIKQLNKLTDGDKDANTEKR